MDYKRIKKQLRESIQNRLDFGKDWTDQDIQEAIDEAVINSDEVAFCSLELRKRLRKELFDSLRRLDILQIFVEDPEISLTEMKQSLWKRRGESFPWTSVLIHWKN